VQAIYDAFVRIWCARGWKGVTTRAVALETGIAVGTLYDYFPNKEALLSGYVRHCIDWMLARIENEVLAATALPWRTRLEKLVRISCGAGISDAPYYDQEMLLLETRIAEAKHHRRVYEELCKRWVASFAAFTDLENPPDDNAIHAMVLIVMGARRYSLLIGVEGERWVEELVAMCVGRQP
jgi:AcrR family transcriptional regulator